MTREIFSSLSCFFFLRSASFWANLARRYASRGTCCFTIAPRINERPREKIEKNERVAGWLLLLFLPLSLSLRISKTQNWSATINHSADQSFSSFPFRGHPARAVRCLISLSDSERRCCRAAAPPPLAGRNDRHRLPCTRARARVPRCGPRAWADAAPCYAARTRARAIPFNSDNSASLSPV